MSIQPFPVFEPQPEPEPVEAPNRLTERDMLDAPPLRIVQVLR